MRVTESEYQGLLTRSAPVITLHPTATIIRQSSKGPNKTETRFENTFLKPWLAAREIHGYQFEALTLRIANGLRYTPDWFAIGDDGRIKLFEIKGAHVFDGALDKLKIAAAQYPWFEFYLYQWISGEWAAQKVLS